MLARDGSSPPPICSRSLTLKVTYRAQARASSVASSYSR